MEKTKAILVDREILEGGIVALTESIDALLYAAQAATDGREIDADFLTIPARLLATFKVQLQIESGGI